MSSRAFSLSSRWSHCWHGPLAVSSVNTNQQQQVSHNGNGHSQENSESKYLQGDLA
ncbi:hypothetical protein ElyMa_003529000 [Elysia marginata]|uniref:Uncharacterized protein n=1 Tax=Elysia marginata TaxID=1093978 RepID=A0AAV4EIQ7_9GAST|nr:hypothetical protein ElyMa_003529000 [Elysia marginata]